MLYNMTTVDIAEARNRFDELIHRSEHGESFTVVEGDKPLASLVPAAKPAATGGIDFLAEARALRARCKPDPTPIKQDIEFGRL